MQTEQSSDTSLTYLFLAVLGIDTTSYLHKCSHQLGYDLQMVQITLFYQTIPDLDYHSSLNTEQVRIEEHIYLHGKLNTEEKQSLFRLAHEGIIYGLLCSKIAMRTELVHAL